MHSHNQCINQTKEKDNLYPQNYTLSTNETPVAPINKLINNNQTVESTQKFHRSKLANLLEKSMNTVASIIHTPSIHNTLSSHQISDNNYQMSDSYEAENITQYSPSSSPPKNKLESSSKKASKVSSVKNSLLNSFKPSNMIRGKSPKPNSLPLSPSFPLKSTLDDSISGNSSDNSSNETIKNNKLAKTPSTDIYPSSILSNTTVKSLNKVNFKNKPTINAFILGSSFSSSASSSPPSPTSNNNNILKDFKNKSNKQREYDIFEGEEEYQYLFEQNRKFLKEKNTHTNKISSRTNPDSKARFVDKSNNLNVILNSKAAAAVCTSSNNWSLNSEYDGEDFMDAFRIFDTDGDGKITAKELNHVLKELGIKMNKNDIKKMIKELDNDGNGTIEYSEFIQMMTMPASRDTDEFELREAFKFIDLDGNGFISREELKDAVKKIMSTDSRISVQDVEEMMSEADTDGNGLIDFDEFVKVLVEKRNWNNYQNHFEQKYSTGYK